MVQIIISRPPTPEYEEGWDRIFKKKCSHRNYEVVTDDSGHYGFAQCKDCGKILEDQQNEGH